MSTQIPICEKSPQSRLVLASVIPVPSVVVSLSYPSGLLLVSAPNMRYSEAQRGRTFVIRLEDGDVIHESIESFAKEHGIRAASVIAVGGADEQSKLVVGPEQARAHPVVPMEHVLSGVSEVAGVGTIFPNEAGEPLLHMHVACGRNDSTVTGCVRRGVKVWHVLEVILHELTSPTATRKPDETTGFELLEP